MNIKYYTAFKGINTLFSPRQVPDDYVIDCRNVIFRDGTIKQRFGVNPTLEQLPMTSHPVRHIIYYNQFSDDQLATIVVTNSDIFVYDISKSAGNRWRLVTPIYKTGTVSVTSGSAIVTGSGTSWVTDNLDDYAPGVYEIGFGTQDPNAVTRWYVISAINSNTQLALTEACSTTYSGVNYCIRRCLSGNVSSWTIATNSVGSRSLVIVDGVTTIQLDDPSTNYATVVTGVNPAKICGFYGSASGEHLLIANTIDTGVRQPMTIEISDIGQPTSFTNGDYIDLYDSNDEIVGMRKLRDYIAVYKRRSISLLYPSYTADLFSVKQNVVNGIGAVSNNVIADCNNYHIFMGETNIYAFDGVNIAPIGDDIKRTLYADINWDYIHRAHALYDGVHDMYLLFVPRQTSEEPDICYAYDIITRTWTIFKFGFIITAAQETIIPYEMTWNDIYANGKLWENISSDRTTWAQMQGGALRKQVVFATKDCRFVFFDEDANSDNDGNTNIPIQAYFITKDYPLNQPYELATVGDMRFYLGAIDRDYYGISYQPRLSVKGSMNYGVEYSQEYLVDTSGDNGNIIDKTVSFALRGTHFRAKISNTPNGDPFIIEGFAIVYNDAGV